MKSKLEIAEKQILQLTQKLSEKDKMISNLKSKIENIQKRNFEYLSIENKVIDLEIVGLFPCTNIEGGDLNKENNILKEKIRKMKNAIIELSSKLEKELLKKEQKNLKINENNSKLFEDLQKKNKELMKMLKNENLQTMALRKEKYDLETICIKQEDTIQLLNRKLNNNISKKKLRQCLYSQSNIHTQNDGLPKIAKIGEINSNGQFNVHNKSGFLPIVK